MIMKNRWPMLAAMLLVGTGSFAQSTDGIKAPMHYINRANMDLTVKPGDNFYMYANGMWVKNNPVPASKTRWGSFDVLREESLRNLKILLEDAEMQPTKDRSSQMIGDFYASGMDTMAIEKKGYNPIKPVLAQIYAINNVADLLHQVAYLRTNGYGAAMFGIYIGADRKNVLVNIPSVGQGGTTLPDRDYYLKDDLRSVKIRAAYNTELQTMFGLIGENATTAAASANAILKIETTLAKAQMARVEMRDPYKTYNKFAINDLSASTPNINWAQMLEELQIKGADSILVGNPAFMKIVNGMLTELPLSDWKTYLRWTVLRSTAGSLSSPFVNAEFEFSKVSTGQKVQTPRWQRISGLIDRTLADLIGQLYVQQYFKPAAKTYMVGLVDNMVNTFGDRIQRLDWMSEGTKVKALEKLHAIAKKIAYPDKWRTYDGVVINRNDFIGNLHSTSLWAYNYNVSKMGKPVDRTEWGMTPPTVNAQYSPSANDITFPAGILQYPFYDFGADDAVNYGGIAAVIGHEMTHGFDDQGRQFDANGNLKDWWTKDDADKFKTKADVVAKQYDAITILDTVHINGRLTLGENLADLGGLNIAFEAFSKTKQFKEGKMIDGFTPQQRFFLSFAQLWENNTLPESAAQQIITDPHSPGIARTNAPITNIDAWYQAFDVKPGDKLYKPKEERTHIW